ncbi:MAG TPA: protein phosphatase 2C domain-containing protein [Blastocatellia bacterium]|nr:protein phosphatase 2C domain-containing protein [Blastocatellia bacterium]
MSRSSKPVQQPEAAGINQKGAPQNGKKENPASSLVEVDLAAQSHTGNEMPRNEDHYLVVRADRSLRAMQSNLPEGAVPHTVDETAYGMIVADGISGMPAGGIASSMALKKLIDLVVKTPDWIMRMNRRKAAIVKQRLIKRFREVDSSLRAHGERDPRLAGMGTTMTAALSLGADLFLGHIGDSRAYLLRDDELYQLTSDHTLAQAMIEAGVATEEDANVRGLRRVLTAALGSTAQPADPEVQRMRLSHGDQLLLCTDGLFESVDQVTIRAILLKASSAEDACAALINEAMTRGGSDNVTVVVARYRFPQAG